MVEGKLGQEWIRALVTYLGSRITEGRKEYKNSLPLGLRWPLCPFSAPQTALRSAPTLLRGSRIIPDGLDFLVQWPPRRGAGTYPGLGAELCVTPGPQSGRPKATRLRRTPASCPGTHCTTWPLSSKQNLELQACWECPERHFLIVTSPKGLSNCSPCKCLLGFV